MWLFHSSDIIKSHLVRYSLFLHVIRSNLDIHKIWLAVKQYWRGVNEKRRVCQYSSSPIWQIIYGWYTNIFINTYNSKIQPFTSRNCKEFGFFGSWNNHKQQKKLKCYIGNSEEDSYYYSWFLSGLGMPNFSYIQYPLWKVPHLDN